VAEPGPAEVEVQGLVKEYPARGAWLARARALLGRRPAAGAPSGPVRAVDGVTFSCRRGEVFGILGPNGAGKTTTLRILSTSLRPSAGAVRIGGHDAVREPHEARRRLGFLSGATGLYGRLTGREMVAYFARLSGMEDDAVRARTAALFPLLGMDGFADRRCDELSTGQKQKVSIARTIVHDPPIVLFDEPTSGLDVLTSRAIVDFIRRCKDEGKCVIFSTHIMSEARRLCDRIALIHKGRIFAEGSPAELCARAATDDLEEAFIRIVAPEREDAGPAAAEAPAA
jgi:sodium transport system ATP-binding protein